MRKKKKGYTYILMNKTRTVNYTGVISDLEKRVQQYQEGDGSKFISKYNLKYLVYFEEYATMLEAIEREKQIKNWKREWKMELNRTVNPHLRDLRNEI